MTRRIYRIINKSMETTTFSYYLTEDTVNYWPLERCNVLLRTGLRDSYADIFDMALDVLGLEVTEGENLVFSSVGEVFVDGEVVD
jgi:hypothetical protein